MRYVNGTLVNHIPFVVNVSFWNVLSVVGNVKHLVCIIQLLVRDLSLHDSQMRSLVALKTSLIVSQLFELLWFLKNRWTGSVLFCQHPWFQHGFIEGSSKSERQGLRWTGTFRILSTEEHFILLLTVSTSFFHHNSKRIFPSEYRLIKKSFWNLLMYFTKWQPH